MDSPSLSELDLIWFDDKPNDSAELHDWIYKFAPNVWSATHYLSDVHAQVKIWMIAYKEITGSELVWEGYEA